ncbi:unnamed protein product [Effrenium voratum]|uniref:CSD domain-containing protein n=1 Tax=Effrenium voratum TaxID=2562239 RepID=A0AA36JRX1_9DINO|nr:unnamed protein product [Effrenium voratum]
MLVSQPWRLIWCARRFFSRQRGVLLRWDEQRGFGKVQCSDGRELFVHKSYLTEKIPVGREVDFEVRWNEDRKQDHAMDVRQAVQLPELAGPTHPAKAVSPEDLLQVQPIQLPPDATDRQHLESLTLQMEQLRQQGLQSQQLLAQNQQLLVQSQQLLVQGLFALIQQQNVQNANLERALTALTSRMEPQVHADPDPSANMIGAATASTNMANAEVPVAEPSAKKTEADAGTASTEKVQKPDEGATASRSQQQVPEAAEEAAESEVQPQVPVAEPSAKKTEADAGTASAEKADGEVQKPDEGATASRSQQQVPEAAEEAAESEVQPQAAAEVESERHEDLASSAPSVQGSFYLVGFFNDWSADSEPMHDGRWTVAIRSSSPMSGRKGVQREEFQILQDGSWEKRIFPGGGKDETVVPLRPGRASPAERCSEENPGHGRNWAVEGKPGASFRIRYDPSDQTVTCEHA